MGVNGARRGEAGPPPPQSAQRKMVSLLSRPQTSACPESVSPELTVSASWDSTAGWSWFARGRKKHSRDVVLPLLAIGLADRAGAGSVNST